MNITKENLFTLDNIDKSIIQYWENHNLKSEDFFCRECGKLLLDLNELNHILYIAKPEKSNKPYFKNIISKDKIYHENNQNRWLVQGRTLSGKTYFRHICWDCFFKYLGEIEDIPKRARKSKWYKKILNGEKPIPTGSTSPSKYFKLLFDITDEELEVEHKKFDTASFESFKRRYGDQAEEKFKKYCDRQAYTCSKEYMTKEKGMSEEEWKNYNQNRASTQENFIKRYGEEYGKKKWAEYCAYESYAGSSLKWFVDKYGEEKGKEIFKNINDKRERTFARAYSNISQDLFRQIDERLDPELANQSYWHTKNFEKEFYVEMDEQKRILRADYYLNGKIIEFNGDYWHANPEIYEADDLLQFHNRKSVLAKDLWESDEKRKQVLEKNGNEILTIWESDYWDNPEKIITECLNFLKN